MRANVEKPICTYFERNGQCRYGDRCRFQHPTSHNSATAFSERSWSESEVNCPHRAIYTHPTHHFARPAYVKGAP